MEFGWEPAKEARNLEKHGLYFVAGAQVLASGPTFEFQCHRGTEPRWVAIGTHPATRRVMAVVYTIRERRCRIISVRRARKDEEEEDRRQVGREASGERARRGARPDKER